jgi:hypothetical protein
MSSGEGNDPETSAAVADEKPEALAVDVEAVEEVVEDDEWIALALELSHVVKKSLVAFLDKMKDLKYEAEAVSQEIDTRVKAEVAKWREKVKYELGDFVKAMDEACKRVVEDATGKSIDELGEELDELSKDIDAKCKKAAAEFCGKDTYALGDLSKEIDRRVKVAVQEFTGKPDYTIGDVSAEIRKRREAWITKNLGKEAALNYLKDFESITKKAIEKAASGDNVLKKVGDFFGGLFKD